MDHLQHGAYKLSFEVSNIVWNIVGRWSNFERNTIGNQLVRSVDSIASNIAEGWSRYYKKDKILFFNYARSSYFESMQWIDKAYVRGLIMASEYSRIDKLSKSLLKEMNGLIKGTQENLKY